MKISRRVDSGKNALNRPTFAGYGTTAGPVYQSTISTAWDAGSFVAYFPGMPIHYRSQWYVLHGAAPLIFGVGIHGQNLFIDRRNELVIAKLSSQAQPLDAARIGLTLRMVSQIRKSVA